MAESQGGDAPDTVTIAELERTLSPSRLAPYLTKVAGDKQLALKFYLWNARLSKAFLYPLHVAEITIRNAMHGALSKIYGGPTWILYNQTTSMPQSRQFVLTSESQNAWNIAHRRLIARRKKQNNSSPITPDDMVAALTFDFWSNLFRFDYDREWFQPGLLKDVFPNLPNNFGRPDVQRRVAIVNDLRNRIAHHEPIYNDGNISGYNDKILELIGWRCEFTKKWVHAHSTVVAVLRAPPTAVSTLPGLPLASANLRTPPIFSGSEKLIDIIGKVISVRPPIALIFDENHSPPYRAITLADILSFMEDQAKQVGGLVDLSGNTLMDVLISVPKQIITQIDIKATTGDVLATFFPRKTKETSRPRVIVVTDGSDNNRCVGLIAHPDVRY
ncbi:Abi family protein [Acetobacter fabarum]|uniref:Abi family protein n=1 Tax=Acetobacter fabarum TaxID=483199 RepID=UPI0039EA8D6E